MPTLLDGANEFLSLLDAMPSHWQSVDIRVVAIPIGKDFANVVSVWRLDERTPDLVPRLSSLPSTQYISCVHLVVPYAELRDLLLAAVSGRLTLHDDYNLAVQRSDAAPSDSRFDIQRASRSDWIGAFSAGKCAHRLRMYFDKATATSVGVTFTTDSLDDHLRSLPLPWDGRKAILRDFLGTRFTIENGSGTTVEIVAVVDVQFLAEHCSLDSNSLRVTIQCGSSADRNAISIGYYGIDATGRPFNGTLAEPVAWRDDCAEFHAKVEPCTNIVMFLRLGSLVCDQLTLRDRRFRTKNFRLESYGVFDRELVNWLKYLRTDAGSESKQFEWAVCRLLHGCGLAVDSLVGVGQTKEAPDALAFDEVTGTVYVVEATVGTLSANGKLARLVERTARLRRVLGACDFGVLLPVIVTRVEREILPAPELDDARADGVAVLGASEIEALLNFARSGENSRAISALIATFVPQGPQDQSAHLPFT